MGCCAIRHPPKCEVDQMEGPLEIKTHSYRCFAV